MTRTLGNVVRQGSVAGAYLFAGPRGTGKTSLARILASALNCLDPTDGDACGECDNCRAIAADRFLDVREIDAASNRQIDDVRALRETVGYAPVGGRYKVYILDEAHMLTVEAWNALLKTLEEPPPNTCFILCTTEARKVLPTVLSRCQRFDFRRLTDQEICDRLAEVCASEGAVASPPSLAAIARRSEGGLRDALSILDQALAYAAGRELTGADVAQILGTAEDELILAIIETVERGEAAAAFAHIEHLYSEGKDMGQVARDLLAAFRNRLVDHLGTDPRAAWRLSTAEALADADARIRRGFQPRLALEIALLHALTATATPSAEAPVAATPTPKPTRPAAFTPEPDRPTASTPKPVRPSASASEPDRPAAQPAPTPSPAVTSDGVPAGGWSAVLERLRKISVPLASKYAAATYDGVRDSKILVSFPYEGQAQIAKAQAQMVERVWKELGGAPLHLEISVDRRPPTPPSNRTAPDMQRPERHRQEPQPEPLAPKAEEGTPEPRDVPHAFTEAIALFQGVALPLGDTEAETESAGR